MGSPKGLSVLKQGQWVTEEVPGVLGFLKRFSQMVVEAPGVLECSGRA